MKALILNSGLGKRMGELTEKQPKCMTKLVGEETILSRQIKLLEQCGITDVVITTGLYHNELIYYCNNISQNMFFNFVNNPIFDKTNYIYSIFLAREYLDDDIVLMHGDLVFEIDVLLDILKEKNSCMAISTLLPLPDKDFKVVIENELIKKIGIEYFENAFAAQPLYKINRDNWKVWLNSIVEFCYSGNVNCYAENAFNVVSEKCHIYPIDYGKKICAEVDTPVDLEKIKNRLKKEGK